MDLVSAFKSYSVDALAIVQNFDAPGVDTNYATFTLVFNGVTNNNCIVTWNSQVIVSFSAENKAASYVSLWDVNSVNSRLAQKCH